jgi:hypothetical protein
LPAEICLKNETKADAERDLRDLMSAAAADVAEMRRERLLRHLESADKAHPLELAKYSLDRAEALLRWTSNNDVGDYRFESRKWKPRSGGWIEISTSTSATY